MGFKCVLNEKHIYSFSFTDEEWYALKADYRNQGLKISCCSTDCVPKENQLGTRFFAHKKLSDCPFSEISVSKEHQYLKYIISRSLVQMGWHVEHDKAGTTPTGSTWIADIYAEKNNSRFIFEIQWDDGPAEAALAKYHMFRESGIKAAWFMRISPSKGFPYITYKAMNEIKVPAFPFKYEKKEKQFQITNLSKPDEGSNYNYNYESLEVCSFIQKLFSGEIHILGNPKSSYLLTLNMTSQRCWNCHRETSLAHKAVFSIKPKSEPVQLLQCNIADLPPEIIDLINGMELREKYRFGEIMARPDERNLKPGLSNGCFYCDAIQTNFYNIAQFSSKNSFVTDPLTVFMPIGFPVNNKVYLVEN